MRQRREGTHTARAFLQTDLQLRHINALARLEIAANLHLNLDLRVRDALGDRNLHEAVVEEDLHADGEALEEGRLLGRWVEGDAAGARRVGIGRLKGELNNLVVGQGDGDVALGERAPEFRPLDVAQDAHIVAAQLLGRVADARDELLELAGASVRRVEPEDVDAGGDELLDHLGAH